MLARLIPGVADVVSFGGYQKEYHVLADPASLRANGITLKDLITAVQRSNGATSGGYVQYGEAEFVVRSRGYLQGLADIPAASPALVIDADTRNSAPARYRALMRAVESGADVAIAAYRRHWHEGNLTNHLARPLIAATLGHDLPQPLAGDLALSPRAVSALRMHAAARSGAELEERIDGYGIDAFIVVSSILAGLTLRSVPLPGVKIHAPSFPHLRSIYHEAVPVLLATTARTPNPHRALLQLAYDLEPTPLPEPVHAGMLHALHASRAAVPPHGSPPPTWSHAVARTWSAVRAGNDPIHASTRLWPHYLDQVSGYLTLGGHDAATACTTLTAMAEAIISQVSGHHVVARQERDSAAGAGDDNLTV